MAVPTARLRRPPSTPLTRKGQLTMPVEVRRHLGVGPRDRIEWVVEDDGAVRVRPARSTLESLQGKYKPVPEKAHWPIDDLIADALAHQFEDEPSDDDHP